jgi:hypothetical protein
MYKYHLMDKIDLSMPMKDQFYKSLTLCSPSRLDLYCLNSVCIKGTNMAINEYYE